MEPEHGTLDHFAINVAPRAARVGGSVAVTTTTRIGRGLAAPPRGRRGSLLGSRRRQTSRGSGEHRGTTAGTTRIVRELATTTPDREVGTRRDTAASRYDPEEVTAYLTKAGHEPFAQGNRYGADGDGYSIYLKDPEDNVVELKCGDLAA